MVEGKDGMIRSRLIYETLGQQFDTYEAAKAYREEAINKFLRSLPGYNDIPLKSRIAFMLCLLEHRKEFRKLLDYDEEEGE